jgi:hypothetical protein
VLPPALHSYDSGMLDALVRHWAGVPVENTEPDLWLVDKENIPKTTEPAFSPVEDYKEEWAKLWGKSS